MMIDWIVLVIKHVQKYTSGGQPLKESGIKADTSFTFILDAYYHQFYSSDHAYSGMQYPESHWEHQIQLERYFTADYIFVGWSIVNFYSIIKHFKIK